ncbi:MAG: DUF423 domain-containing protein [Ferruginibacter sp.]
MHKGFLKLASILAAISIAFGAFGAHSLKEANVSRDAVSIFETAVRYQFYHVFALFIVAILYKDFPFKTTIWAGRLFVTGIILFSGSLYFLTWVKAAVIPGYDAVGAVTPIGGLAFIGGWICLLVSVSGQKR